MYITPSFTIQESRNWNISYGNKLCNLLYVASLCESHNAKLLLSGDSVLNELLDLNPYVATHIDGATFPAGFVEQTAFRWEPTLWNRVLRKLRLRDRCVRPRDIAKLSQRQFKDEWRFLKGPVPAKSFSVHGTFWHFALMPSPETFAEWLKLRPDVVSHVRDKYPDLQDERCVAVHVRGTDFETHLLRYFPQSICLDAVYYEKAMALAESIVKCDPVYHVFTDEPSVAMRLLEGREYVIHSGSAIEDWTALHLMRKVIQSNSTFCWTASLYNKDMSIQPAGGYNYREETGDVPYGFRMPFSHIISNR